MTIILFLVDTSASMCQKAYINGVQKSYLDIAKGAIETFLKYRQRSSDCMGDRYMLLTFEDPPANVKAGWKENHGTFMNELKNLQSNGLTSMGEALRNAFDLLNLNRMQSGIDTYGQGRCPFYLEPSVIIVITDGGKYSFKTGVQQEIILPLNTQTGAKLTKEPFRWDQRLFSLVLRMAGNRLDERPDGKVPHDDSPIEKMCEVTGGRSYRVRSHHVLNQCIESLVQKVQAGVVVHLECPLVMPAAVQDIFGTSKKMIYVQKHPTQKTFPLGFWPIPEPYWPDNKTVSLPARDAHPRIRICTPGVEEPPLVRNFPVDKYEVELSPLTLQILCKRDPTKCWPVYIANGIPGCELPFGYLKASATFTQVHLVILPYNYLTLLPLLNDLFHKFGLNPPSEWVFKFTAYVRAIPQYYGPFLRRALASASVPFQLLQYILPENLDSYLSPTMATYLKTMKNNAKQEQENMCLRVFKQLKLPRPAYHQLEMAKLNCGQPLRRDLVTHPQLRETFAKMHAEIALFDAYNITVPAVHTQPAARNYRNPFDVPRRDLIDEIARMRENFLKLPTHGIVIYTKDAGHSLPIADMGNYQEYLKNKQQPLREIEPTNVRQHMFGNPYKKDKHMVMVDEADVGEVGGGGGSGGTATPPPSMGGGKPAPPGMSQQQQQQHQLQQQQQQQHQMQQQQHQQQMLMMQQQQKKEIAAAVAASRPRKRKAGPIHRDYVFKRRLSSSSSTSSYCGSASRSSGHMSDASSVTSSSMFSDSDVTTDDDGGDTDDDGTASISSRSSAMSAATTGSNHHHLQHPGRSNPEQRSTSSAASSADTDDDCELVIDFNDDDATGDEPLFENGHVKSFINGDADETPASGSSTSDECSPVEPAGPPPPLLLPPSMHNSFGGAQQQQPPQQQQQHPVQSMFTATPTIPVLPVIGHGAAAAVAAAAAAAATAPAAMAAVGNMNINNNNNNGLGTPAGLANHHLHHAQQLHHHNHHSNGPPPNDFHAQEISKILQQCTNGGMDQQQQPSASSTSSTASSSSASISNHLHLHHQNNSSSSDHATTGGAKSTDDAASKGNDSTTNHKRNAGKRGAARQAPPATISQRSARQQRNNNARQTADNHQHSDSDGNNNSDDGASDDGGDDDETGNADNGGDASSASFNGGSNNDTDTNSSVTATSTNNGRRNRQPAVAAATAAANNHCNARRRSNRKPGATGSVHHHRPSTAASLSSDESDSDAGRGGDRRRRTMNSRRALATAAAGNGSDADAVATDDDDEDDEEDDDEDDCNNDHGGEGDKRVLRSLDAKENVRLCNVDARRIIFRDIRRPGRDYSQLLEHLRLVRGSRRTRGGFIQMCVDESLRFRRKKMAETIQTWWEAQAERRR